MSLLRKRETARVYKVAGFIATTIAFIISTVCDYLASTRGGFEWPTIILDAGAAHYRAACPVWGLMVLTGIVCGLKIAPLS